MKLKFSFVALILFSALSKSQNSSAQIEQCAGYKIDEEALRKTLDYETSVGNRTTDESAEYVVRVYFHICRNDDGSNASIAQAGILDEFNKLVSHFEPANNICFLNVGVRTINNTTLNTYSNTTNLFDEYRVPNCINIFYTQYVWQSQDGITFPAGGVALGIPSTICFVARSNIGTNTISHEIGHCIGLVHTHETVYGWEMINGSNSQSAGDRINDTRADPYAHNANNHNCYSSNGCQYTGSCLDPNGQSNYNPPYNNIMSYWSDACVSQNFTINQFQRMRSYLDTDNNLIQCQSTNGNLTEGPVNINAEYRIKSATGTLSTNGTVNYIANAKVVLGGETVILNPGFVASPNGGWALITTSICSADVSTSIDYYMAVENINSDFSLHPNPVTDKVNFSYSINSAEKTSLTIYNLLGERVANLMDNQLSIPGKHEVSFNSNNLSSGVYIAVFKLGDTVLKKKWIKQ